MARFLDREAEIKTSYGGNFVDAIEGVAGGIEDDMRSDWFFYVNGHWSPVGAAEAEVEPGDRIWWDYRHWEVAYRVPVVVGSWPAPFAGAPGGDSVETRLDCASPAPCEEIESALRGAGADVRRDGAVAAGGVRVLAGAWEEINDDPDAALLTRGPEHSGVYVDAAEDGFTALDERGHSAGEIEGLIAAVRRGDRPPTWIVTGLDRVGLERVATALGEDSLAQRYALGIDSQGNETALPAAGS